MSEKETLCWGCKNAICGCSWADDSVPVKGWNAEKTIVKDNEGDFESYCVKACPEYVPDKRRIISAAEIARRLGVVGTTITQCWAIGKTIEEMAKKGYTVKYDWTDKLWYEIRR